MRSQIKLSRSARHWFVKLVLRLWAFYPVSMTACQSCSVLHLLNVEPYPVNDKLAVVWDKGLELIPAGHLAAEQINKRSDILPGYELKLIDVDSEACGLNVISKGVANTVRVLVDTRNQMCIVGVVGLFCSPVTKAISPIVSHPKLGGYIQIVASTSPLLHAESNLFHIIRSSSVFSEATLALMKAFGWQRISSVHNSRLYFRSTADNFVERILSNNSEYKLITHVLLSDSTILLDAPATINNLNTNTARISFWSVSYIQATFLLCEAYHKNLIWPGYIYIIQEHSVDLILRHQMATSCSKEEILTAMEGVFLLQYRLSVESETRLFSNLTYSDNRKMYIDKLEEFNSSTSEILEGNIYANSLYDQVWAFALALNNSLPSITSQNISFEDYRIGKRGSHLSGILRTELKKISLQGASGWIHFGEDQESPSYVNIFQIQNKTAEHIGVYDPFTQNITFTTKFTSFRNIPPDMFETIYNLLPLWLLGCMLVGQGILFIIITTNLVLILKWRKVKEVKAISPLLSILMLIGCYILSLAPVILAVSRMLMIKNDDLSTSLCILKSWASIGIELIFATLFWRMLRIHRIFHTKQMTVMNDYWVNGYLFIYSLLICMGKIVLLIIWNSVDPIKSEINQVYISASDRLPYYQATLRCRISRVWSIIILLYSGVLLFMVVVLAIQTRHIKNNLYKDTKKVNIFIFLVVIILTIAKLFLFVFDELGIETGANVSEWLAYLTIPLLCQGFLFIPKILPLALKNN